jgi:C4-dicarboxylate-specific signal transduction histidine kinase
MVIQQSTRCTYCLVVKWLSAFCAWKTASRRLGNRHMHQCRDRIRALAVDCEVEQRQLPAVAAQPSDHHDDLRALAANHILG